MTRSPLVVAACAAAAVLAAPASALAAAPIPGATYAGKTDSGNTFSLTVSADGSAVTRITTSATLTCTGAEGGSVVRGVESSKSFPVASDGGFDGKDEDANPRLDPVRGRFTSSSEVSGTIRAWIGRFTPGVGASSCSDDFSFTARAVGPGGFGNAPSGGPSLAFRGPATGDLERTLRDALTVRASVGAPARIVAVARLAKAAARRYDVTVLARRAITVRRRGGFALELDPSAKVARRLRDAESLRVVVTLTATVNGERTTRRRTIALS